jgi:hypothetical protein
LKKLFNILGIDRAVSYTLLGRGWGIISGLVTLWFISKFLTPTEQGFYYTFASILALQVVFELGLSYVIMQFASHEMAHLSWTSRLTLTGEVKALNRLSSLLLLVVKWYGVISILIIIVIMPAGWMFFKFISHSASVLWQTAWVWLIFTAAINIFVTPIFGILEGCGKVTEIAIVRLIQVFVGSLSAWLVLIKGGALLAMPVMNTLAALTAIIWIWWKYRFFFRALVCNKPTLDSICWKTEIWPFQSKVALSWLSGYLIFQLFVPVLFVYRGAVEAGQMGMSLNVAAALSSLAIAWINTKSPTFGCLIALKQYDELDLLFFKVLLQSSLVISVGALLLIAGHFWLAIYHDDISMRLLPLFPFLLLLFATVINHIVAAEAVYLRAHKDDPFMSISITVGGLMVLVVFLVVKDYGSTGMMVGYFIVSLLISLGMGSLIFNRKRLLWHQI